MLVRSTISTTVLLVLCADFCGKCQAQTNILFEEFEASGSLRTRIVYTSPADASSSIAAENYCDANSTSSGADISYSNIQGTHFYGAQDTEDATGGAGPNCS